MEIQFPPLTLIQDGHKVEMSGNVVLQLMYISQLKSKDKHKIIAYLKMMSEEKNLENTKSVFN